MGRGIVLAAALALVAAGCIGTVGGETTDAADARASADEQAEAWNADAQLVSVTGFEGTGSEPLDADERGDPYEEAAALEDDELADGQAPAWVYEYRADEEAYRVAVAANGTVLAEDTGPLHEATTPEDDVPITGWEVSSTEAAEIAAEHNDTWAQAEEGWGFYGLGQEDADEDPVWAMGLGTDDAFLTLAVNATTGEFLGAHPVDLGGWDGSTGSWSWNGSGSWESPEEPPREQDTHEGSVDASEPTAEHGFHLADDEHDEIAVQLSLDEPAGSTVSATLFHGDEEVGSLEATPTEPSARQAWPEPDEGEHRIEVALESGATQDYTVHWCAPGASYGDTPNPACQADDGASRSERLAVAP